MGIELNFDFASALGGLINFLSQDPLTVSLQLFLRGGWVIFLLLMIKPMYYVWLDGRMTQYTRKWKYTFLAIDIPKNNEQTPKAVENIFIGLAGAHTAANFWDKYYKGRVQESFSFEIASLEGYIQFIIRTPSHFRDLVEANIYAQYPDAEITEVEDYTKPFQEVRFPNDQYNLWGTEFVLTKDFPYPIRLYSEFEHSLTQTFLDPMAGILEILTRLGKGEQLWLQLIVTPQASGWPEKAKKVVKELMGQEYKRPQSSWAKSMTGPTKAVESFSGILASVVQGPEVEKKREKDKDMFKMFNMSPGERLALEGIQKKLGKRAFRVKFRYVYLGEKEVFNKGTGVSGLVGAVNQFSTTDVNGFKPGSRSKTQVNYFFVKQRLASRQNKIIKRFIGRSNFYGEDVNNMFMNTEELASVWHFPAMTVKALTLERTISKRAGSSSRLPIMADDSRGANLRPKREAQAKKSAAPRTLEQPQAPVIPDTARPAASAAVAEPGQSRRPAPPPNLPTI